MKKLLIALILMQFLWAFLFVRAGIFPGEPVKISGIKRRTLAVLTVDFNEPVKSFERGKFYALKVLQLRGSKIDFGLCEMKE